MRISCNRLNRSNGNIAVWMAIYTSILFATPNHSSRNHHPVASLIAAAVVLLAAGAAAWYYRTRCKA